MDIAAPVLQKEKPKPKVFVIQELINRQMGNNPKFASKFYGSLQAVQRLELMRKLDDHQVNFEIQTFFFLFSIIFFKYFHFCIFF